MSSIQSPLHSHVLFRRNLSQHFQTAQQEIRSENGTPLRCQFCLGDFINGSTSIYCCETCGFYFHTSCALPAPLQIQHPRHQHPLGLQQGPAVWSYCNYGCVRGCKYELRTTIAMRTLQVEKYYCSMLQEASDGESRLPFAHDHPLTTVSVRTGTSCGGCQMQISAEEAYGCSECRFFLHEACAKAPLKIQHHPFHPKHTLYLSYHSSGMGRCHACRRSLFMKPIRYRCEECELIFDLSCVISTMPREDDDDGEREDISRRPSVIDHPLHPHQLSSYHSKTQTEIKCSICEHHIPSGNFFGCSDCSFFLHGSCAQPPIDAIQHYLHPEHTLTFAQCPDEKGHKCAICESRVRSDSYCYTCQMCDLFIHPFCASATLLDLEKGVATTVQYPFHEHELKLYRYYFDFEYDFELDDADNPGCCTVCEKTIRWGTLAYKCFSQGCYFKIHKSCLQPPSDLEHPSHSLHPLTFCFKPPEKYIACRGCYKGISNTAFYCGECNFYLHVDCPKKPTLKHPFHGHRLFYFEGREYKRKCRACHKSCRIDLFSCAQCDYTLHYECSQLPLTLESEHHGYCGPLVLRESFIEDERAEYYCDICERRRDPKKCVYFCETCNYNFVAHVECALSTVKLEVIEEDDFIRREEEIRIDDFIRREEEIRVLQEQVDAKEASLRPLMKELQSMRAEVKLHEVELAKRKAEHAKWI